MNETDPTPAKIEHTKDGSHTLYSPQFNQHYHNPNGAVAESHHVFFEKNGLGDRISKDDDLTIFEMGFGTGLNFLLLMDYLVERESAGTINYCSIDAYPVDPKTAGSLNYGEFLHEPVLVKKLPEIFKEIETGINIFNPRPNVTLHLFNGKFDDFNPAELKADFLFHDPFSPEVNEELWSGKVFKKLAAWSNRNAVLSTYCAASKARGAMAWAGWHVAREQGALGKREMTVASLNPDRLAHLKRVNEERLAKRYETGDF